MSRSLSRSAGPLRAIVSPLVNLADTLLDFASFGLLGINFLHIPAIVAFGVSCAFRPDPWSIPLPVPILVLSNCAKILPASRNVLAAFPVPDGTRARYRAAGEGGRGVARVSVVPQEARTR